MERRKYLMTVGTVLGAGLAGCTDQNPDDTPTGGSDGDQTGVLATAVSDDPGDIGDFEKLEVTLTEIWAHQKGGDEGTETSEDEEMGNETSTSDGAMDNETSEDEEIEDGEDDGKDKEGDDSKVVIPVDDVTVDLVKLQGDKQSLISEEELPTGEYTQIKLWVKDDVNAVLKSSGEQAKVVTPGNAPLKFNKKFEIRPSTKTTFVADFSPHKRGPNGYIIKPVAEEVSVSYSEVSTKESVPENGTQTDNATAENGTQTDNATAETESE